MFEKPERCVFDLNYTKKIIGIILCFILITGSKPMDVLAETTPRPALYLSLIPCGQTAKGQNFFVWSNRARCIDNAVNNISSRFEFEKPPVAGDKFTYVFFNFNRDLSTNLDFTILVNNARVETQDGKVIYLNELNGVYNKPAKDDIICDFNSPGIDAAQFYKGEFKVEISVIFGSLSDYGSASNNKFPASGKVTYNEDMITLDNVNYNGTLTLTGGKKYTKGVTLLLKGKSTIAKLNVKCPVKIASDGNASLACKTVNDSKGNISVLKNIKVSKKGAGKVFTASVYMLKNLADITFNGKDKTLPQDLYYSVEGNTITLEDFHFDGEIKFTGGGYDHLRLVLKGNNSIGALSMNCPVSIEREYYADLTCGKYSANAVVKTDQNTSIDRKENNTVIGFTISSGHQYIDLFNSEISGFRGYTSDKNVPTTVTGIKGITQGIAISSGSELAIDITNKMNDCSPDEKVALTFYARAVSDNPNNTAFFDAKLFQQNLSNPVGGYFYDIFQNTSLNLPITTTWQKFCFTGFLPAADPASSKLSLSLGYNNGGATVEIAGVKVLGKGSMTVEELDELSGMYDYDWRHKDAKWRLKAQQMIESNRKGSLSLNIIDGSGKSMKGAKVTVKQTDYDYQFGASCSLTGILHKDGSISTYFDVLQSMGVNSIIDYSGIAWENYFDDGDTNTTFEFDQSDSGDADYVSAAVKAAKKNGAQFIAQVLVYPSFHIMRKSSQNHQNYDELVAYVLSNNYTPEGFKQRIKDHVKKVVTSYAGVINEFCIVNEAYFSKDFFKLIYGKDGTGVSRETIAAVTNGSTTNDSKISALENWLNTNVDLVPAKIAAKYVGEFSDSAQEAWIEAGCNPDELTLYYNDAATKFNDNRKGEYYNYVTDIVKELAKPQNYKGGKVLIDKIGFQFADWGYGTLSPNEIWSILDEYEAIGFPIFVTEFNYWVDNAVSIDNSKYTDYGRVFRTSSCYSEVEKQFMKDYTETVMTALYVHNNSRGIMATCYLSGQIGYFYNWSIDGFTPMGEAFSELVQSKWLTPEQIGTYRSGKYIISNAALGKYDVTVKYGKVTKTFKVNLSSKSTAYTLDMKKGTVK